MKKVCLIYSCGLNGEIGKRGDLCWRIPADLSHFRYTTFKSVVIMGRKTYKSLNDKSLPDRINIILSSRDFIAKDFIVRHSIVSALRTAELCINTLHDELQDTIYVIGGAKTLEAFKDYATEAWVTHINAEKQLADAVFKLDTTEWNCDKIESTKESLDHPAFSICHYFREEPPKKYW